jgi:hypothetical protein
MPLPCTVKVRGVCYPRASPMDQDLGNLSRLSPSASRSISAENPGGGAGEGGQAVTGTGQAASRDLGRGWKVSPASAIEPGQILLLVDIEGPGSIRHVWMGVNGNPRLLVLRISWEGNPIPAVECPVDHFFACGWGGVERITSLPVCMNPRNGLNCWWSMPFRSSCRITAENVGTEQIVLYYQVDCELGGVPEDAGYFHAQFHGSVPRGNESTHVVLDETTGRGQYVGTYLAWQPGTGHGGDGRTIEFHIDGGGSAAGARRSGLAEYFGFSGAPATEFSTPYCGLARATGPEGAASPFTRFGLYRWHVTDPIRFASSLCVVIGSPEAGLPGDGTGHNEGDGSGQDDGPGRLDELSSVAYWYQEP